MAYFTDGGHPEERFPQFPDPQFLDAVSHLSNRDAVEALLRERSKRMSFKDDPLQQHHTPGGRTLWLNRENMGEARENFWRAYHQLNPTGVGNLDDRHIWDISWAAAIAAFSFVMEGRTEPR